MGKYRLASFMLVLSLLGVILAIAGCSPANSAVQAQPTLVVTVEPGGNTGGSGLDFYNDPDKAFSILMPTGWHVNAQQTSPLVKKSTIIVGPQGHIAVLQLARQQLPAQNMDQLLAAVQLVIGTKAQANYVEINKTKPTENSVQVESTFTREGNRASHSVMTLRAEDDELLSLWMVVLDEAVWAQSVPAVQAIMNSYKLGSQATPTK